MPALKEVLRMPNASIYKYRKIFRKKQKKRIINKFSKKILFLSENIEKK